MERGVRHLNINVMRDHLPGGVMVVDADVSSWLQVFRPYGDAVLPELRAVFPNENRRLAWLQRPHVETKVLKADRLDSSIERQPVYRAGIITARGAANEQEREETQ